MSFALFWNAFVSIFVIAFIVPILTGKQVHFKTNDIPTSGSLDNWESILFPSLIISLFVFVGTETRFIKYRNGKMTIKDWEQFFGNINIKK